MSVLIAPSILAADFGNLQRDIEMINASEADWFHVDVMDGMFVPNISFGMPIMEVLKKHARKPLDVHLMIEKPERYLEAFRDLGAFQITVHYETCPHLHRTLQHIRSLGLKAGVAINPSTSVSVLENIISEADLALIMSVNPGFGGQKFIPFSLEKVGRLKELIITKASPALVQIDGGVNLETGAKLARRGCDVLVAGSFVFGSPDPLATIQELKKTVNQ
ncbi:MAG: ribulose-phosphate 3-epimerase [Cytophagaceae bacterium]|jgi:ribulose-phosphate 3-epimerase|nr:ribulose-phosphate 3-epimerase [Cytophagaceae bacterium]